MSIFNPRNRSRLSNPRTLDTAKARHDQEQAERLRVERQEAEIAADEKHQRYQAIGRQIKAIVEVVEVNQGHDSLRLFRKSGRRYAREFAGWIIDSYGADSNTAHDDYTSVLTDTGMFVSGSSTNGSKMYYGSPTPSDIYLGWHERGGIGRTPLDDLEAKIATIANSVGVDPELQDPTN